MSKSVTPEEVDLTQKRLCAKCVGDNYLKKHITDVGRKRRCSYCSKVRPSLKLRAFADLVEAVLDEHYQRTTTDPNSWERSLLADRECDFDWERSGEPVTDVIANAMSVDQQPAADIQVILAERHSDLDDDMMGEETAFDSDSHYQEAPGRYFGMGASLVGIGMGSPNPSPLRKSRGYRSPLHFVWGLEELKSWRLGASIVAAGIICWRIVRISW